MVVVTIRVDALGGVLGRGITRHDPGAWLIAALITAIAGARHLQQQEQKLTEGSCRDSWIMCRATHVGNLLTTPATEQQASQADT
jgi:hypothetical protein